MSMPCQRRMHMSWVQAQLGDRSLSDSFSGSVHMYLVLYLVTVFYNCTSWLSESGRRAHCPLALPGRHNLANSHLSQFCICAIESAADPPRHGIEPYNISIAR